MTPNFKDHFSGHAADYRAFRPVYPPGLFAFLASVAPDRNLVWDCGTGSGQAAVGLAEHFAKVFATDASAKQLGQVEPHPRVEYVVAPAEKCPLADHTADLVTVTQALHWFDFDRFYAEVRRVCRPLGLLAATCYYEPSAGPGVDPVLRRWEDFVRPYWTPERKWVDAGYRTIPFPFPELASPPFELSVESNLAQFLGYLGTWSAAKLCAKALGFDPLTRFGPEFAAVWGDPATVRTVRWEFNVRLGRVG
ncbi:MAG TPA: class I SAM-dependent methyltransferase [Gemmataceae bacterium]|nr:class I SAM-dependent methyltransferase [Gemmataceae bacterium]